MLVHACRSDAQAKGKIVLDQDSRVVASADRPFCFRIVTQELQSGLLMQAANARERKVWMRTIRHTIAGIRTERGGLLENLTPRHNRNVSMDDFDAGKE